MANQEFRVYNSMSQQKEILTPNEPGKIRMYVCGITAYDDSHIGHARAAVAFDVLYRYLKYLNYEVTYVRNFTDVDDKIICRAKETNEDPLTLSNRYCEIYRKDMDDLQCLPPTHEPRVSDHIDHIINMITQIINNDYAYIVDGNVYFAVDRFPNYGRLSGRRLEDNRAGERVTIDSRKRNPADFALWKAEKKDEISWDSPWGRGRPGWHIECSAMSAHFLSCKFDIHGGGIDLFFPHHENEFAQSCAACQESNVGYWMHNGHVTCNNEKMSKSLGNFITIHQITICYHPLALRYFLMSTQYRSPLNYSKAQLEYASDRVFYIFQTLQDCEVALSPFREGSVEGTKLNSKPALITPDPKAKVDELSSQLKTKKEELRSEFQTKMSDDLLTPPILNDVLVDALRLVNRSLNMLKEKQGKQHQLLRFQSLIELEEEIKEVLKVLGFLSSTVTYSEVLRQLKDKALTRAELDVDVSELIGKRAQARKNKNFALSDEIRNDLTAKGISLMDVGSETIWKPCVRRELEEQSQPEST